MAWGQADGSLLLLDYSTSEDILLDLTTGAKTPIDPIEPLDYCAYVSPNRSRIACSAGTGASAKLVILDHQGKIIKTYPWKDNWYFLDGWLNDGQVILTANPPADYEPYQNLPTTLFNIGGGNETVLLPDYPEINNLEPFNQQGPLAATATSYSPNLKLAVYEAFGEGGKDLVLWDRQNNTEAARVQQADTAPYPQWNPAGDQVVVAGRSETRYTDLFILSKSGGAQQVTDLREIIFHPTSIYTLGWSPDGKRIAFELTSDGRKCDQHCIGIFDVDSGEVEIFNFSEYRIGFSLAPNYALTWSPDSRYLLLPLISIETDEEPTVVFDVEQGLAYQVATNARIEGWLARRHDLGHSATPTQTPVSTGEVMPLSGDGIVKVTDGAYSYFLGSLNPEQTEMIAFAHDGSHWRLVRIDPDQGSFIEFIPHFDADSQNPQVSPDGKYILVASNGTGDFDIYIMDYHREEFIKYVTSNSSSDISPDWFPDGNRLVYIHNDGDWEIYI
ncbi:MAG: PD40 domain-containing protein [Anaerolineales bacterium]|nr:PD40 domain-containing protein [Anaerolineales bacterium]